MIDIHVFAATILAILSGGILIGLLLGASLNGSADLDSCSKISGSDCVMIAIPKSKTNIYKGL